MIDARSLSGTRQYLIAGLLGTYAAGLALAPSWTARIVFALPLVAVPAALWTLAQPQRWAIAFLLCALTLPPLPIPMGDSGPHLAIIFAGLGAYAGILRMREWRIRAEPVHVGILAYPCVLAASVSLAAIYSGPAVAAQSFARVALFAISVYVFFYTAYGPEWGKSPGRRMLSLVYAAGLVSAAFACVDFYFQLPAPAGFGAQFVWMESGVYRRAQGVFYEASTLGNICAFFLIVTAVALMSSSKMRSTPISRPALLAGIVVFPPALMLSFSRASLVNLLVAAGALLLLQRRINLRLVLIPAAALGAGAAGAHYLFPRFTAVYWERIDASVTYLFAATEGVLSGRVESWRTLSNFLLENPWHAVMGVGYKTLPYSDVAGRAVVADNAYLSALVETGIVGVAAMLLFNFAILRTALRAARHSDLRAAFFGTCVFCFWCGQMVQMMSGDLLTYWRVLPVYLWALGMAVRHSNESPAARSVR